MNTVVGGKTNITCSKPAVESFLNSRAGLGSWFAGEYKQLEYVLQMEKFVFLGKDFILFCP